MQHLAQFLPRTLLLYNRTSMVLIQPGRTNFSSLLIVFINSPELTGIIILLFFLHRMAAPKFFQRTYLKVKNEKSSLTFEFLLFCKI
jgi:hypothetical protein